MLYIGNEKSCSLLVLSTYAINSSISPSHFSGLAKKGANKNDFQVAT
jgi:hypothetical protein